VRHRSIISESGGTGRVNVTPMIDVVMVLIVFYLLVGQLAVDRRASIDLPSSRTGIDESAEIDPILIGIHVDGVLTINGEPIERERFAGEIQGMHTRMPSTPVRVRGDRDTPFGLIRPIMDQLRDGGITRVELMTEQQM